jgi:hypothetical protein
MEFNCKTYDEVQNEVFKLRALAEERNTFSEFCHLLNHIANCKSVEQCNRTLAANYDRLLVQVDSINNMGTPKWEQHMNELIRKYTGWDSFAVMCLNTPTLRIWKGMSMEQQDAIQKLRDGYAFKTGKKAFPENNWYC